MDFYIVREGVQEVFLQIQWSDDWRGIIHSIINDWDCAHLLHGYEKIE
jgi:hypothetical protein